MAQIIDKVQFELEQKIYRKIQEEAVPLLDKHMKAGPSLARQFYIDSREESFVFEKNLVLDLLNQPFAQYLRVYYGAIPPGKPLFGRTQGSPTIILGAARKINPYIDVSNLYLEWPEGLGSDGNPV